MQLRPLSNKFAHNMRARTAAVQSLLVAILLCWRSADGACDSAEATVGFLYSCELTRNDFFPADLTTSTKVEYSAALSGRPGLPSWLTILQVDTASPGYMYGTPGTSDVGKITLEVKAMDRVSFVTEEKDVEVFVIPMNGEIVLTTEFYLTNYNTDEFLAPAVFQLFSDVLQQVFANLPAVRPGITRVTHPSTRDISIPVPPAKHGVIAEATPGANIAEYARASVEEAMAVQGQCSSEDQFDLPPASFELFADSGFAVDWCQFQVYVRPEGEGETLESTNTADDVPFVSRPSTDEGSVIPLVVIAAVCGATLIMAVIVLGCVFFGGRKQALYVPKQKRMQKAAVLHHAKETSSGPKTAQRYLRDLAQLPRRRQAGANAEDEGVVLANGGVVGGEATQLAQVQQLTGFGGQDPVPRPRDPPPYTYPQDLTQQPLQSDQEDNAI